MKEPVSLGDIIRPITDEDMDNLPKDEWVCSVCNSVQNQWRISLSYIVGSDEKYVRGNCLYCEEQEEIKLAEQKRIKEENERQNRTKNLLEKSMIPDNIVGASFEKMEVRKGAEKAFKAMQRINKSDRWIYLYGDNSVGKSYLIGATINMLAKMSIPSLYFNETLFFNRIKSTWEREKEESESQIFNMFKYAKIVFWDEFLFTNFMDERNAWKYERAYALIEELSEYKKIIVFTSNVPVEDENMILNRAGRRILARLKRNNFFPIKMENKPFF